MTELDKALDDLSHIRARLAAGSLFQGFGPAAIAATGLLAVATAGAQTLWPNLLSSSSEMFLGVWIAAGIAAAALIGCEMIARSRRRHGGLSTAMIVHALEKFLPSGFAGATVAAVLLEFSRRSAGCCPGYGRSLWRWASSQRREACRAQ